MKDHLLRAIYRRYRTHFYRLFVDEFFADIPKSVQEPAMTFLSEGKERLEKWALFQARMLQSRIVSDPKLISTYDGMLMMLKLLLLHTEAPARKQATSPTAGKPKRDDVKEATAATEAFKKLLSPTPSLQEKA